MKDWAGEEVACGEKAFYIDNVSPSFSVRRVDFENYMFQNVVDGLIFKSKKNALEISIMLLKIEQEAMDKMIEAREAEILELK